MIPEVAPYNNFAGDGTTTQFDFDFYIEDATQLTVQLTQADGTIKTLVNETDYTIHEVQNENGSYITFPILSSSYPVLSSDEIISLSLTLPIAQESEYGTSSELDLVSLEYSFDYLTRICQIQQRLLERAAKVPEGIDGIDTTFPYPEANQVIQWDENGKKLINYDIDSKITNIQGVAGDAKTIAESAASDASTALTTANTAVSTANTANTNASNAVSTASTAATNASTALTTANTAASTANAASTAATNAKNKVESFETDIQAVISAADKINQLQEAVTTATTAASTATSKAQDATTAAQTAAQKAQEAAQYAASVPTVNNGTLTIKKNNVIAGTFTANSAIDTIVDINETIYYEGDGIEIDDKLQTAVSVECSNENLTVTSSYTGTKDTVGTESYEFEYDEKSFVTTGATGLGIGSCCIINGKLYVNANGNGSVPTLVNSDTDWEMVGSGDGSYQLGIKGGCLYQICTSGTTAVLLKIGTDNTWSFVSDTMSNVCHGINNGVLYKISIDNSSPSATLLDNSDTWTYLCGGKYIENSNYTHTYGICGGTLYRIHSNVDAVTQINTDTTWTKICGASYTNDWYAYGINNGYLYTINNSSYPESTNTDGWTDITGYSDTANSVYAYGIRNGYLYYLSGSVYTVIGSDNTWTKICGSSYVVNGTGYVYGINNGKLYRISGSTVTQIGTNNDWTSLSGAGRGNTIAIRNNNVYLLYGTSVTLICATESAGWYLNNTKINPASYDLTITGTPQLEDTIDLTYTTTVATGEKTISDKGNDIITLAGSGTIALADNKKYSQTVTGNVTFTLPTVTDTSIEHQIKVEISMASDYSIDLGLGSIPHWLTDTEPSISSAGNYNLYYEYDKIGQFWRAGVLTKGEAA